MQGADYGKAMAKFLPCFLKTVRRPMIALAGLALTAGLLAGCAGSQTAPRPMHVSARVAGEGLALTVDNIPPGREITALVLVDPAGGNYSLASDSPALQLGFKPIDVSRVGLQGDPAWVGVPDPAMEGPEEHGKDRKGEQQTDEVGVRAGGQEKSHGGDDPEGRVGHGTR